MNCRDDETGEEGLLISTGALVCAPAFTAWGLLVRS